LLRRLVVASLLLLAACAVPNGPPANVPATETTWAPPDQPRAVIVAVHGLNYFKGACAEFGDYATKHGLVVEAYDQPGFGAPPDRGHWPGTPALVAALDDAVRAAHVRYPNVPVYVLGESMGAAVTMMAMTQPKAPAVAGLILAAPAVWNGQDLPTAYRTVLRVLANLLPALRVNARHTKRVASDTIEMLRGLGADPLVLKGTRVDAIAGLVGLMDTAALSVDRLDGPLLVLGGARDEIVPPGAHQAMLQRLSARPCTEIVYQDGYHMLLRDLQRAVVWNDILAWIDQRTIPSGRAESCPDEVSPVVAGLP
jgi:alpha-beta hydrolase superfamily lysophospholipase